MGIDNTKFNTKNPNNFSKILGFLLRGLRAVNKKLTVLNFKAYTALLTQSGVTAPVATELANTLGGEVTYEYFTEEATGSYKMLSDGLFKGTPVVTPVRNTADERVTIEKISDDEIHIFTSDDGMLTDTPLEIKFY